MKTLKFCLFLFCISLIVNHYSMIDNRAKQRDGNQEHKWSVPFNIAERGRQMIESISRHNRSQSNASLMGFSQPMGKRRKEQDVSGFEHEKSNSRPTVGAQPGLRGGYVPLQNGPIHGIYVDETNQFDKGMIPTKAPSRPMVPMAKPDADDQWDKAKHAIDRFGSLTQSIVNLANSPDNSMDDTLLMYQNLLLFGSVFIPQLAPFASAIGFVRLMASDEISFERQLIYKLDDIKNAIVNMGNKFSVLLRQITDESIKREFIWRVENEVVALKKVFGEWWNRKSTPNEKELVWQCRKTNGLKELITTFHNQVTNNQSGYLNQLLDGGHKMEFTVHKKWSFAFSSIFFEMLFLRSECYRLLYSDNIGVWEEDWKHQLEIHNQEFRDINGVIDGKLAALKANALHNGRNEFIQLFEGVNWPNNVTAIRLMVDQYMNTEFNPGKNGMKWHVAAFTEEVNYRDNDILYANYKGISVITGFGSQMSSYDCSESYLNYGCKFKIVCGPGIKSKRMSCLQINGKVISYVRNVDQFIPHIDAFTLL